MKSDLTPARRLRPRTIVELHVLSAPAQDEIRWHWDVNGKSIAG
jgi:hypothetical protein